MPQTRLVVGGNNRLATAAPGNLVHDAPHQQVHPGQPDLSGDNDSDNGDEIDSENDSEATDDGEGDSDEGDEADDEGDEDDAEEEAEEPKLKYRRLANDVTRILMQDDATCLAAHDKFLVRWCGVVRCERVLTSHGCRFCVSAG